MIQPELSESRWDRRSFWWVAAVVLLLIATAFLGCSTRADDDPLSAQETAQPGPAPADEAAPAAPGDPGAPGAPEAPGALGAPGAPGAPPDESPPGESPPGNRAGSSPEDPAAAPPMDRSVPVQLRIPAIGVSTSVGQLGLNRDNTVEVPTDFQQAGWFGLGPTPGETGSSVILGHVDSFQGPAVFFRLRTLKAGDDVQVTRADGSVAHFAVTSVATYPKEQFPAEQVYAPHGGSALHLVTCGGEFDRSARSYLSNIVAYTSLVSVSPAPAG
jgi:sortase (surface protein transpeptidase)